MFSILIHRIRNLKIFIQMRLSLYLLRFRYFWHRTFITFFIDWCETASGQNSLLEFSHGITKPKGLNIFSLGVFIKDISNFWETEKRICNLLQLSMYEKQTVISFIRKIRNKKRVSHTTTQNILQLIIPNNWAFQSPSGTLSRTECTVIFVGTLIIIFVDALFH